MQVDFAVAVPNQAAGLKIAEIVSDRGYTPDVSFDDEDEAWTCYCSKTMLVEYDAIVAVQRELAVISEPFDSFPDGWGTFGNAKERVAAPHRTLGKEE
jgi:hypothetical protein